MDSMIAIDRAELEKDIIFTSKDSLPSENKPLYNDQPQLHDWYELFFVKAGEVSWFIENEMYPVSPYTLTMFNSQEIHKLHIRSNKRFERMKLLFNPALARQFQVDGFDPLACFDERPKGKGNIVALSMQDGLALLELFKKLAASDDRPETPLSRLITLMDILVLANRLYRDSPPARPEDPVLPNKVADVMSHVAAHLADDLSLEAISSALDINRFYLCRIFKKETGSTLHNYILYKRISEAKKLLRDGLKTSQVCAMCGFGSMARFTASFRNIVGQTPAAYAKAPADSGIRS
jgi:AraC-like DNA-binding protein